MSVWDTLTASRVAEGLARQLRSHEVAHAWLLLGPSGAGKRPISVAMAAALQCEVEPRVGCGSCSTCLRVLRHRHPDVHRIAPEGPIIPVDVIRESVIPEAARSPFEGHMKVFIIEEAERMHPSAQNALLKTLEEPTGDVVFILIVEREEDLLDTIRSRSRVIRLEAVPEDRLVEQLVGKGIPEETAVVAARVSEGDLERALALVLDEAVVERRKRWMSIPPRLGSPLEALDAAAEVVEEAKVAVKALEGAQKEEAQELADMIGERRGTATARNALSKRHKREQRRREEDVLDEALRSIASFYRDVLALRRGAAEAVVNIDMLPELESWVAAEVTDAALLRAAERCVDARATFISNPNQTLAVEATLVEIGHLIPSTARVHS